MAIVAYMVYCHDKSTVIRPLHSHLLFWALLKENHTFYALGISDDIVLTN